MNSFPFIKYQRSTFCLICHVNYIEKLCTGLEPGQMPARQPAKHLLPIILPAYSSFIKVHLGCLIPGSLLRIPYYGLAGAGSCHGSHPTKSISLSFPPPPSFSPRVSQSVWRFRNFFRNEAKKAGSWILTGRILDRNWPDPGSYLAGSRIVSGRIQDRIWPDPGSYLAVFQLSCLSYKLKELSHNQLIYT